MQGGHEDNTPADSGDIRRCHLLGRRDNTIKPHTPLGFHVFPFWVSCFPSFIVMLCPEGSSGGYTALAGLPDYSSQGQHGHRQRNQETPQSHLGSLSSRRNSLHSRRSHPTLSNQEPPPAKQPDAANTTHEAGVGDALEPTWPTYARPPPCMVAE